MNDIKYEPAFGNQTFFDGAPEDAVLAVSFCDGIVYFSDSFKYPSVDFTSGTSIAMRRVIRTPVWTKADQLAGKVPEVGCEIAGDVTGINKVLFSSDEFVVTLSQGGAVGKYIKEEVFDYFSPIESPEEKAARLRKEWCVAASKQLKNLEYNSTLTSIYDALLSGDLPVPGREE